METTHPAIDLETARNLALEDLTRAKLAEMEAAQAKAQAAAELEEQRQAWRAELAPLAASLTVDAQRAELEPFILRELAARREIVAVRSDLKALDRDRSERAERAERLLAAIEGRDPRSWADLRGRGIDLVSNVERNTRQRLVDESKDLTAIAVAFGGR